MKDRLNKKFKDLFFMVEYNPAWLIGKRHPSRAIVWNNKATNIIKEHQCIRAINFILTEVLEEGNTIPISINDLSKVKDNTYIILSYDTLSKYHDKLYNKKCHIIPLVSLPLDTIYNLSKDDIVLSFTSFKHNKTHTIGLMGEFRE